jgi:hypothetical protein
MLISDEIDQLLHELGSSLIPPHHDAFLNAAKAALESIPCACLGPGSAYRALAQLQRMHFDPPPDGRTLAGPRRCRPSKLAQAEPIGAPDPREGGRDRHRLKLAGG